MTKPPLSTTSSINHAIHTSELSEVFSFMFNDDAKQVFANKTYNLTHQYDIITSPLCNLYNTIELLALLDIKSANYNPCENLVVHTVSPVKYFGITCSSQDLDKARNKLIDAINDMASNKWLIASLYNLGTIELASDPLDPTTKRYIVFSYLAPYDEHIASVDAAYGWLQFQEGSIPPEFK